jgi:hypothetical protein
VQPLPVKAFIPVFQAPVGNAKTEAYVTLLDRAGREMPKKSLPLNKKLREGYNDLQEMIDHVNERIEELLRLHGQDVAGVPKVCAQNTCKAGHGAKVMSQLNPTHRVLTPNQIDMLFLHEAMSRAMSRFMHTLFPNMSNLCNRACFQCMRNVSQVRVVLHHSFFMLKTAPESLAVPVMANLRFAPNLRKLASEAVAQAKVKSASETFNGLHLRVEGDVTKFIAKVRALCEAECPAYHLNVYTVPPRSGC